jgi:SAM-dependent methyltransferase
VSSAVRQFLLGQQYNPGLAGVFVNPFFLSRRALWRAIASSSHELSGPLLDVGCGSQPYRSLFSVAEYIGLEFDTPETRQLAIADVFYDGGRFPFDNGKFASVLCNQVLEHVFNPAEFVAELFRVLRPGGRLLLTVPFVWDEHHQPYDYARYSSFGLLYLLKAAGFKIINHQKLLADASVLFQLTNSYLQKITHTRSPYLNLMSTAVLLSPISILGLVMGACLPRNEDLFLDQLVLAERVT